ncbi:MAG: hypothetical protein PVH61_14635 [Candidatus Aminicenantes bacterium]|jgi:hypothetical protein
MKMKQMLKLTLVLPVITGIIIYLSQCGGLIAGFDPIALENATSLKKEALDLMDKANEPYDRHQQEINALETKLEQAYQYAKEKPKNTHTASQWEILKDPGKNLLGGFIKHWQEKSQLSTTFIEEAKKVIADAFATIIALESGKSKK